MDGNPYSRILRAVRSGEFTEKEKGRPVRIYLGTVASKNPLRLFVSGVLQPTSSLRINIELREVLDTGDEVLLLTEDDQIFFILMKVVKAQ